MLLSEAETENDNYAVASSCCASRGRRPYACREVHRWNLGDPEPSRIELSGTYCKALKVK